MDYMIIEEIKGGGEIQLYPENFEEAKRWFDDRVKNPFGILTEPLKKIFLCVDEYPLINKLKVIEKWKNPDSKFKKGELKELRRIQKIEEAEINAN
jgi:hypothetical protein